MCYILRVMKTIHNHMKQVKVLVTTMDGEVLDSLVLELPNERYRYVAVRPCNTSIGQRDEEILTLPEGNYAKL